MDVFKVLAEGFAALGQGFADIFNFQNKKPRKKIEYKPLDLNKIIGRDLNDPNSGWRQDAKNINKDWEKVLGKNKLNRARKN